MIQVGDLGIGFTKNPQPQFPANLRFIRGNHDNPELCQTHPQYLGDYGYDPETEIFWLGGAWSIDASSRLEGRDWWRNEELSAPQIRDAFELYANSHPKIVVTHDCPMFLYDRITNTGKVFDDGKYSTPTALEAMWNFHQPRYWFFGHHHKSFTSNEKGTRFMCLKELEKAGIEL